MLNSISSSKCSFLGDIAGSHLEGLNWTWSGCQMGCGVAIVSSTLPCLTYLLLPSFVIAWENILMRLFFLKKEQFPSQLGVASSTQVHPPSQGKDIRKGTLSKVWRWRGDLSKRYFWIVKQPLCGEVVACLGVYGLRRKEKMTRGKPGASHESTHPCKEQPMKSNGNS